MIILVYTKFNTHTIQENLGRSEYSYYFVLHKFLPVLENIGQIVIIENPSVEVDEYYERALEAKQKCVFLCFSAPHNLFLGLKCPTIPVFAWEYDTIPNEIWDGNERNNWVIVLEKLGAAITHSNHSVEVIQKELNNNFPIISCPCPIEAKYFDSLKAKEGKRPWKEYEVIQTKEVIDTGKLNLKQLDSEKGIAQRIEITHVLLQKLGHEVLEDILPKLLYRSLRQAYLFTGAFIARSLRILKSLNTQNKAIAEVSEPIHDKNIEDDLQALKISGIIYTSVLNILDGRKNYKDMVASFCHALGDKSDATLILKTPIMDDLYFFKEKVFGFLQKLPKFKCRVIIIGYYLDSRSYLELMDASTFYVNTSFGEGQCLPLMEYMAAGVPAIAPQTTALADYISPSNAFVFETGAVPTSWQHDDRMAIRSVHHRPDWYSLVEAFRTSYDVAKNKQSVYQKMSLNANATLIDHASFNPIKKKLKSFLEERLKD